MKLIKKQCQIRKTAGNDNLEETVQRNFISDLKMGISFYSRLPLGDAHNAPILNNIAPALPFASLLIGFPPALLLFISLIIGLPPLFAASIAIGLYALITGAMSEDAIADSFDALFGGQNKAQRLDILKDSRHGTYGVIALVLYIALRVFALGAIAAIAPLASAALMLGASILARSSALYLVVKLPSARKQGASASAGVLKKIPFIVGLVFAFIFNLILVAPFAGIFALILAFIFMVIITLFWTRTCEKLIAGQTGDLIGALQALLEIAAFSGFLIALNI